MKIKIEFICLIVVVFSSMFYGGCSKVKINPNDMTAPNVKLEIKKDDGEYQSVTEATLDADLKSEKLTVRCVVDDPDGIKSMRIYYSKTVSGCTIDFPANSIETGNHALSPLPKDQEMTSADDNGTTLDRLFIISEPLHGPFSCDTGSKGKGVPHGQNIRITCEGVNWSSNSSLSRTEKIVNVKLK